LNLVLYMASDASLGGPQIWVLIFILAFLLILSLPGWSLFVLSVSALQGMNAGHHHGLYDCVSTPRSILQFSYIPRLSSYWKTCISDGLGVHEFCSEGPQSLGRFGLEPDHTHTLFFVQRVILMSFVLVRIRIGLHPGSHVSVFWSYLSLSSQLLFSHIPKSPMQLRRFFASVSFLNSVDSLSSFMQGLLSPSDDTRDEWSPGLGTNTM
jgi:hypothetical protein